MATRVGRVRRTQDTPISGGIPGASMTARPSCCRSSLWMPLPWILHRGCPRVERSAHPWRLRAKKVAPVDQAAPTLASARRGPSYVQATRMCVNPPGRALPNPREVWGNSSEDCPFRRLASGVLYQRNPGALLSRKTLEDRPTS